LGEALDQKRTGRLEPLAGALATVFVLAAVASLAGSATAARARLVRVTFIGDSVPASIAYVPTARARLRHGMSVRLDLRVCRRLVQPSCPYHGSIPTTALQAVESDGPALGEVLIVNVGYNESAHGYGRDIDRVMRAAISQGVRGVVWVTLRETRSTYHWTNVAIRMAAARWSRLAVADWNGFSHGHAWFRRDGLHLTPSGANALATFLRPYIFSAAKQ
jgi:hypothetical protein